MVRQCANGPHRAEYTTYCPPQDWEGRPFADDGSADITGGGGGRRRPDDGSGGAAGSPITATAAAEQHRRTTRHLASPRPEGVEDARVTGDAGRRGAGAAADVQRQQHCVFDSTIPEPEEWQPSRRFQPRYVAEGGGVGVAGDPAQDDVLAFTGGRKRSAVPTARGGTPAHPPTQLFGPPFPAPPGLRGNKRGGGGGGGERQAQLASSPLCGGNTQQQQHEEDQQQQQRRRHDEVSTPTPRRSAAGAGGGNSSSPLCGGYCPPPEEWQGAPCVDEVLDRKLRSVW